MFYFIPRIDNISWKMEESKKDNWKREDNIDTRLSNLSYKIDQLKDLAEILRSSPQRDDSWYQSVSRGSFGPYTSQIPPQNTSLNELRRENSINSRNGMDCKPQMPRRFLSQNPYMHMPVYNKNMKVKEAAWYFRRPSLKGSSPSKEDLSKILSKQENFEYMDSVDAPPPADAKKVEVSSCFVLERMMF